MFQTIAILSFLTTFVGIAVHWIVTAKGPRTGAAQGGTPVLRLLVIEKGSLLSILKKLCYLAAFLCFVLLALTGFWPVLILGEHISGWPMMVHATCAPVFALCLAILALTWAAPHRFEAQDAPWLPRLVRRFTRVRLPEQEQKGPCLYCVALHKLTFWLILFLALPLILSIVLSMLHLLGTEWQHVMLALHRWTSLGFAIVAIVHTYLAVRLRTAQGA